MITTGGKASYSNIIKVDRANTNFKVRFGNIVNDQLSLRVNDVKEQRMSIKIIDPSGKEVYQQNSKIKPGENLININANNLSNGFYYLILTGTDYREAFPFIKS
jgi:riboflavin synthase alpha subunit